MAAEAGGDVTVKAIPVEGWTVTIDRLATPIANFNYEVRLHRPDGTYVVMSRDDEASACVEDMQAAAFAIAAVLEPEANGPWIGAET